MDVTAAMEGLRLFIQIAAVVLEATAALIILLGAGWALARYVRTAFSKPSREAAIDANRSARVGFGRSLLLALEFTVGSTVLKVSVTPTLEGITVVAVAVAVRVVLAFVLQRELSRAQTEGAEPKKGSE
jgi:uncharacterized membrane protein